MASGIYNHRSLQPSAPGSGPSGPAAPPGSVGIGSLNRLNEAFDTIRHEFDALASDLGVARSQRDEFESKISAQITETELMRRQMYELENKHSKIRQQYEDEIARMRSEIHLLRQNAAGLVVPPPPPALGGPGVRNIPPPPPPQGPGGYPSGDLYLRERELRDREREMQRHDRDRDIAIRERERERSVDPREAKRLKVDRTKADARADIFSPSSMPKLPPPGATTTPMTPASPPMGFLEDMDPQTMPPELKKEGSDWFAVFNPKVKRVLDVNLVHTLMHESVVCCVRFSADGRYLATGCNRTAQIYDTKTGLKTCSLADDTANKSGDLYIRSVCFSPDGKLLATGAEDKQIRIWDIAKKSIRSVFDGHQQEIYSLDFSSDGRVIVSGSGDKTARIWSLTDGSSKVLTINDPDSLNNDAGVTSVAISPNGQFVAAGSLDTLVRIWDVHTGHLVERLRGHRDSVYSVAFTPDGKGLVSGSLDKTLKYWDMAALMRGPGAGGKNGNLCTMNFTGHKDYVLSVAVSHDGRWVVSGSKDRGVQFWDSRSAIVQCMLQGHKNSVISIDLSPTGSVLATGSGDWQARIWSYTTI